VAIVPKGDVRAASERLTRAKVAHAVREGAIRLAPHCYNTEEEIRTALAVMVGERGA
jgi:selenocysteine lyase/cysteine desulfurase